MNRVIGFSLALAVCCARAEYRQDDSVMSDAYWEIWNPEVQKKIDDDIAKYRMADAKVVLEDAVEGDEVSVEQVSHAFFFGAHIFNYNQLGKREWNDRYKKLYGTLFNSATVAFYWRTLEPHPFATRFREEYRDTEEYWNRSEKPEWEPHWRRPATDPVVEFLKMRNVRIHGHPLVWGDNNGNTPRWLWDSFCPAAEKSALEDATGVKMPQVDFTNRDPMYIRTVSSQWQAAWKAIYGKLSEEEIAALVPSYLRAIERLYENRVREIAERYGSRIDSWDVVNESATDFGAFGLAAVRNLAFDKSLYGPMPADYAHKAFTWAQKYLPRMAWLNINDWNMSEVYPKQIDNLVLHGARIDVVGSQMHLFNPRDSEHIAAGKGPVHVRPDKVAERFQMLAKANRPIHLSEITITAPDVTPRGQMIQAIITKNLYRAWFSVENMNGITWWNVVDGCGWAGEPAISGLFMRDMTPKTVYFMMDDLINREWKTRLKVKARSGGRISFRGFKGRYKIDWKDKSGKKRIKHIEVR